MLRTLWILFLALCAYRPTSCLDNMPTDASTAEIKEYCDSDGFRPICQEDEVILMKHARYGRMRSGRCLPKTASSLGCFNDVQNVFDEKCSGRRSCDIPYIQSLAEMNGVACGGDLREYLEAAYDCIKVAFSTRENCAHTGAVEVRFMQGYLSSFVTQETGCGSEMSPWWITARKGQQIRIRLFDFFSRGLKQGEQSVGNVCQVYAVVREEKQKRGESICASPTRESLVYTSESHRVEVQLIIGSSEELEAHFLLEFEVFGCPNPEAPANGWIKRNGNEAHVGCVDDKQYKWKLQCQGTSWVGKSQNCSAGIPTAKLDAKLWFLDEKFQVLTIMVAVGIVIFVCLCLLLCAVIYVKRNWKKGNISAIGKTDKCASQDPNAAGNSLLSGANGDDCYYPSGSGIYRSKPEESGTGMTYPPPPYSTDTSKRTCTCQRNGRNAEHDYEQPLTTGRKGRREQRDRKYYELDPNYTETERIESV